MAKLDAQTLEQLYDRPKFTRAVELAIIAKSDFSKINAQWCNKVCKLKCKNEEDVSLQTRPVDILVVQDHQSPPGKYDRRPGQQEHTQLNIIDFVAKEAGFAGLTYRVVSLLKCEATETDFPSGKPPTQVTMRKCFPYLEHEILSSKPKVIISLGTATTKALGLSHHSNTGNRGEVTISDYDIPVVMTLHPKILSMIRQNARGSAGMWGPDYLKTIQRDFQKAADLARGKVKYTRTTLLDAVAKLKEKYIRVARSMEDVQEIMTFLGTLPEESIVSFDTETTSLDTLDPNLRLLSIQFGWRGADGELYAAVIPLWHRKNTYFDPDTAWELVVPFLVGPKKKVGHNSKYDILAIFWSTGVRVRNVVFDTLLLLHSICSGAQGTYGLKSATWDFLFETGTGGYEDLLGDLKDLKKQREKAQGDTDLEAGETGLVTSEVFGMETAE